MDLTLESLVQTCDVIPTFKVMAQSPIWIPLSLSPDDIDALSSCLLLNLTYLSTYLGVMDDAPSSLRHFFWPFVFVSTVATTVSLQVGSLLGDITTLLLALCFCVNTSHYYNVSTSRVPPQWRYDTSLGPLSLCQCLYK